MAPCEEGKPGCGGGGVRVSYEVRSKEMGRGVRLLCIVTFSKRGAGARGC
jgi:hypothetical protein